MVDYTERRKTKRKKGKWPRSKFIRICPQEMLSQRVKRPRRFLCVFLCRPTLPWVRASTERRKTKKNLFSVFIRTNLPLLQQREERLRKHIFCGFNADWPFPRVDYTERRKIMRKNVKCPRSKFISFGLKEHFHRDKKD